MDDNMSIDKKEDMREPSVDSMESSPEAEAGPSNQEHTEQPKRKGGRKPVCYKMLPLTHATITDLSRSMPRPKNESNGIDKLRQLSENDARNTSSNWRKRSVSTRRIFTVYRQLIEVPQTNVSCSDIRTRYSREYSSRKVFHSRQRRNIHGC